MKNTNPKMRIYPLETCVFIHTMHIHNKSKINCKKLRKELLCILLPDARSFIYMNDTNNINLELIIDRNKNSVCTKVIKSYRVF